MFRADGQEYFCHEDILEWTGRIETSVLVHCAKGALSVGRLHDHDFYELTVVMDGQGDYTYQGVTYRLKSGDAFITPPSVRHQYTNQRNLEVLNFIWYPQELPVPFSVLESIRGFRVFFDLEPQFRNYFRFEQRLVLRPDQLSEVRMVYLRMAKELQEHQEGFQVRLSLLLYDLLLLMCRWYSSHGLYNDTNELTRVEKVVEYLGKHYRERIERKEMASLFAQGERSFAEKFKKIMGETFSSYLLKIRLQHAQSLLLTSDRSLTDIAWDCGFCDSNYLCAVFRKKYGMSPHQYRLNNRSE